METLPEKEVLFNRFYYGEMSQKELESLVTR